MFGACFPACTNNHADVNASKLKEKRGKTF